MMGVSEELRTLAGAWDEWGLGGKLTELADRLERQECVSDEDAEAAKWVREHGGLDELDRRLMPPGYEWPRFVSGELVKIGDMAILADDSPHEVESIEFFTDKSCKLKGKGTPWMQTVFKRQRVKRHAVLAADGEPLEVGQTVWDVESCVKYEVVGMHIDEDIPVRVMRADGSHLAKAAKPSTLTHQRPVLDADGVPIVVGDEIYGTVEGGPFIVTEVSDKGSVFIDAFPDTGMHGSMLTHTKPEPSDSWEQLEEDYTISERRYYATRIGHDVGLMDDAEIHEAVSRDLVRRAKALAERERCE